MARLCRIEGVDPELASRREHEQCEGHVFVASRRSKRSVASSPRARSATSSGFRRLATSACFREWTQATTALISSTTIHDNTLLKVELYTEFGYSIVFLLKSANLVYNMPMLANDLASDQSGRAYDAIRNGIVTGHYRPGQRLVESELARREGVSRTPIREALRWLEREGVVRIEKRRGARVCELSAEQISDLYELRARLEALACELAALRASDDDRAELERIAKEFEQAVALDRSVDDFSRVRAANAALHRKITQTAGNPFLVLALDATIENPLVLRAYRVFSQDELDRSVLFHQLIVEAICRGRGDRAGRLMLEHILQARDSLVAHLEPPFDEARE